MSRQTHLRPEFVEFIPEQLEPGILYISRRYSTATHLCCCGCGLEVVTPLNPAKWQLTEKNGKVSLYPSVGSWSLPCQSHYWIFDNRVEWVPAMSSYQIEAVKRRDKEDAASLYIQPEKRFGAVRQRLAAIWTPIAKRIRGWLRG